jgi:hypothetical protein
MAYKAALALHESSPSSQGVGKRLDVSSFDEGSVVPLRSVQPAEARSMRLLHAVEKLLEGSSTGLVKPIHRMA